MINFLSFLLQFCSLLSAFFGILYVIGRTLSGMCLLYVIVMGFFLTPGICIHLLPNNVKTSLKRYLKDFSLIISGGFFFLI